MRLREFVQTVLRKAYQRTARVVALAASFASARAEPRISARRSAYARSPPPPDDISQPSPAVLYPSPPYLD